MKKIIKFIERLAIMLNKEWKNPFYMECDEQEESVQVKIAFILATLALVFPAMTFFSKLSWGKLFDFICMTFFICGIMYFFVIDTYKKRYGYFPWDKRAP